MGAIVGRISEDEVPRHRTLDNIHKEVLDRKLRVASSLTRIQKRCTTRDRN